MIAWNPSPDDGRCMVVLHPDKDDVIDKAGLTHTDGACWSEWEMMSEKERMIRLLMIGLYICHTDDIPIENVISAFACIPEFVKWYSEDWQHHGMR